MFSKTLTSTQKDANLGGPRLDLCASIRLAVGNVVPSTHAIIFDPKKKKLSSNHLYKKIKLFSYL